MSAGGLHLAQNADTLLKIFTKEEVNSHLCTGGKVTVNTHDLPKHAWQAFYVDAAADVLGYATTITIAVPLPISHFSHQMVPCLCVFPDPWASVGNESSLSHWAKLCLLRNHAKGVFGYETARYCCPALYSLSRVAFFCFADSPSIPPLDLKTNRCVCSSTDVSQRV